MSKLYSREKGLSMSYAELFLVGFIGVYVVVILVVAVETGKLYTDISNGDETSG